jgi:hypothetical protein
MNISMKLDAAGKLASDLASSAADAAKNAASAVSAAYKDMCPGTMFQFKNQRTTDGRKPDPNGLYKVCQEKRLIGKNDPPVYFKDGQLQQINKKFWDAFGYTGLKKGSKSKKGKKGSKSKKGKKRGSKNKRW